MIDVDQIVGLIDPIDPLLPVGKIFDVFLIGSV